MSTDTGQLQDQQLHEQGTELATVQASSFADTALTSHREHRTFDNFQGDKQQRYVLASMATGPDCLPGEELVGQEFRLKYWMCHDAVLNGDLPGELIEALRVVFITDDGKAYAFISDGIVQGLQLLVRYLGPGPWSPSPLLKVSRIRTSKGRSYYKLSPAQVAVQP